jgi:hypothetical protein
MGAQDQRLLLAVAGLRGAAFGRYPRLAELARRAPATLPTQYPGSPFVHRSARCARPILRLPEPIGRPERSRPGRTPRPSRRDGEGSYPYLLDRSTTVPLDAPLVAFDTRKVPREVAPAVLFVLAEHVSGQIERQADARLHARDAGLFAGRSILVIDEALERSMPGHPIAPLWRRFRDSRSRCPAGKGMGDGAAVGSC